MALTRQPTARPRPGCRSRARAGPHTAYARVVGAERVLAVFTYFLTVYKRTWRGSIIGRFLSPLFFLLAMGIGLGSLVDDRVGGVDGLPYLQFVVPAIVATQTMWVAMGESTYQVLGYIKWNMGYHAMLASPLSVRDVLRGHFLAVAAHLTTATAIFMGVAALFGGFGSVAAVLACRSRSSPGWPSRRRSSRSPPRQEGDNGFNILFRWIVTPLMLFSGTFFPIEQLPGWMQPLAWVTPLWHGVEACRAVATGTVERGSRSSPTCSCSPRMPRSAGCSRSAPSRRGWSRERRPTTDVPRRPAAAAARLARLVPMPAGAGLARMLVERNITSFRHGWIALVTGFAEPVFYLFSLGIGIGALVADRHDRLRQRWSSYPQFVAPALLAASAMNGAVFDSTFNVFFKLRYAKLYDAVLATPMGPRDIAVGEISWSLIRGGLYSAAFLVVALLAGAVGSWWALLALPAAVFIGFAFAALGMFATTFMKSWVHFDFITLAIQPMFLFSATFFPLSTYPEALQWLVRRDAALPRGRARTRPDARRCRLGRARPRRLPRAARRRSAWWAPRGGSRSCCSRDRRRSPAPILGCGRRGSRTSTRPTAYRLWALRSAVFVVEQDCPYLDLDGRDLEPTDASPVGRAGRDLRWPRCGCSTRVTRCGSAGWRRRRRPVDTGWPRPLVQAALESAGERAVVLDAQSHLVDWYAAFGFVPSGPGFLDDGIPHTPMRRPGAGKALSEG